MGKKQRNVILTDDGYSLEIDVSTPKHPDAVMKIEKSDWDYIQNLGIGKISAHRPSKSNTLYGQCAITKKTKLKVHRLILSDSKTVDHIDGDGLNNLRENIRECSSRENNLNKPSSSRSRTGIRGISWDTREEKWFSRIHVNGKAIWLGAYDNIDIAIGARQQAEKEHYGEFAYGAK